ncbi:hypothetical protein HN51_037280 [Arachis hypogaea]
MEDLCSKSATSGDKVVTTTDETKENHKSYKTTVPSDLVPAPHTKDEINKQEHGAENAAETGVASNQKIERSPSLRPPTPLCSLPQSSPLAFGETWPLLALQLAPIYFACVSLPLCSSME